MSSYMWFRPPCHDKTRAAIALVSSKQLDRV